MMIKYKGEPEIGSQIGKADYLAVCKELRNFSNSSYDHHETIIRFEKAFSNRIGAKEGSQSVDFLNVEVWGKMAENCAEYLKKGSGVAVSGDLHIDNYVKDDETRYSVKLVNCDVQFLAKPNGEKSEDKSEKE